MVLLSFETEIMSYFVLKVVAATEIPGHHALFWTFLEHFILIFWSAFFPPLRRRQKMVGVSGMGYRRNMRRERGSAETERWGRERKKLGAGSQCGYPNFCPTFVFCLVFVQHRSSICLHFVLVKHLSNIFPKNPTFVPSKSNICLSSQTFVLHLSSDLIKVNQKLEGQNLVIIWLDNFSIWHLVTLHW